MKAVCCDTSFLMSLYGADAHSRRAEAYAGNLKGPITISSLNQFEVEQALNLSVWRKQIPFSQTLQIKLDLASDCSNGSVIVKPCNFANVFTTASRLSTKYTPSNGHRTLDILHVAAALELGAGHFLSFDLNQRKLAKAEGLKLNP